MRVEYAMKKVVSSIPFMEFQVAETQNACSPFFNLVVRLTTPGSDPPLNAISSHWSFLANPGLICVTGRE